MHPVSSQLKALSIVLPVVYTITILVLLVIVEIGDHYDIPVAYLTRDTTTILKGPAYAGLISNIGILIWCATAAICFFTSGTLSGQPGQRDHACFLFLSGITITVLTLDDLFLLHENISRHTPLSQTNVYTVYVVLFLFYLIRYRQEILASEYLTLLLAFVFFGLSMVLDVVEDKHLLKLPAQYLIEDGFKLIGIVSWLVYYARLGSSWLQPAND